MDFEALYRDERPRVLATLIRLIGDFDLAEETLQDAFTTALQQWPQRGFPHNPSAWLISAARNKAIDRLRRERRFEAKRAAIAYGSRPWTMPDDNDEALPDDVLRLIFTCCHPALALEAQVALTLKTVCGLSVDQIARAFLVPGPTMAQRLARAKGKIRSAHIPYEVPAVDAYAERLDGVLRAIYLVFTESYSATGSALPRPDLSLEAIRLGRLLRDLLPAESEVGALLGLMLLHDSRRAARLNPRGELVMLEDQDRMLWNRDQIAEGKRLAEEALSRGGRGFYALQAVIAALHAQAAGAERTDWAQIEALYVVLLRFHPSPVVALNHAAAVALAGRLETALRLVEQLEETGALRGYHLLPSAKADILRRLGRCDEAAAAYERALALVTPGAEQRYLLRRLAEVREGVAKGAASS